MRAGRGAEGMGKATRGARKHPGLVGVALMVLTLASGLLSVCLGL